MNKDEALKMAIAELSKEEGWMDNVEATIIACKKALEKPAQEPINNCPNCNSWFTKEIHSTPAPLWQGLTEEEFIYFTSWVDAETLIEIEQALKEKNT